MCEPPRLGLRDNHRWRLHMYFYAIADVNEGPRIVGPAAKTFRGADAPGTCTARCCCSDKGSTCEEVFMKVTTLALLAAVAFPAVAFAQGGGGGGGAGGGSGSGSSGGSSAGMSSGTGSSGTSSTQNSTGGTPGTTSGTGTSSGSLSGTSTGVGTSTTTPNSSTGGGSTNR